MDRKLASVQKITGIDPIEGADLIEVAQILGWQVVIAKKDGFKVGDEVVYIETDSIMPDRPEFEFLRSRDFRIKIAKFKKQVSQGIVFPLSILPPGNYPSNEGDDVTEILGVIKHDPQGKKEAELAERQKIEAERRLRESNNRVVKYLAQFNWFRRILNWFNPKKSKGWPKFVKHTDEDRIQLFPNICEDYKDIPLTVTEKLDGQSATYVLLKKKNGFGKETFEFMVCSRTLRRGKPDDSSYWTIANSYNIEKILRSLINDNDYIVLQGEIIGVGIQKNKYDLAEGYDFYAFNLVFPTWEANYHIMKAEMDKFNIKCVPLIDNNFSILSDIPAMVEYANAKSVVNPKIWREGIVCRHTEKNISFKVISPTFLLKYKDD